LKEGEPKTDATCQRSVKFGSVEAGTSGKEEGISVPGEDVSEVRNGHRGSKKIIFPKKRHLQATTKEEKDRSNA